MWVPTMQHHASAVRTSANSHYIGSDKLFCHRAISKDSTFRLPQLDGFPNRRHSLTRFLHLSNGCGSGITCSALSSQEPFDQLHWSGPCSANNAEPQGKDVVCTKPQWFPEGPVLPWILIAVGAFLALECPAVADIVKHGISTVVPGKTPVSEVINSGWAGLVAGCLHTLTGLDHLAALAPLCMGRPTLESAVVGALWGCGHDAGQIIFGLIFLVLKGKLKIELFQVWASRVIGLTLLAIGAVGLKEAQEVHVSVLATEGANNADTPQVIEGRTKTQRLRTFATGLVYGLQPDALIMVLPALALPSRLAGAAYLGMFLVGTIISMGSYTAFIGSCGEALQKRLPWITQRLSIGSSVIAILFGLGILFSEFFGLNFF